MSDTPELIKGVLVNGQIHKIDYNALANKPSIPVVPDLPSAVTQLDSLLVPGNNGKYVGIESSQFTAKNIESINDYIILAHEHAFDSSIYSAYNNKCIHIGEGAFSGCTNMSIASFENATYVGAFAFNSCSNLVSCTLWHAETIGEHAFTGCSKLQTVQLYRIRDIQEYAFNHCSSLISVNVDNYTGINVGDGAFIGCINFQGLHGSPVRIGKNAFEECSSLSILASTFFENVTYIGSWAFASAAIYRPYSGIQIASINVNAVEIATFYNFLSETLDFNFPECILIKSSAFKRANIRAISAPMCKRIEAEAFRSCYIHYPYYNTPYAINDLFPEVTYIGEQAFESFRMSNETRNLTFGKVEYIDRSAFRNVTWLSRFYAQECLSIATDAFSGCTNLISISIPKVKEVYGHAFENCSQLSQISLPNCSFIGESAFRNCSALYSIYLLASSKVSIPGVSVFEGTPVLYSSGILGSIYVPSSLYSQYIADSYWSDIASRIVSM